jgi:hypothetical protein
MQIAVPKIHLRQDILVVQAIIITNSPETLRSSVLRDTHQNGGWLDSSLCLGIPKASTKDELEVKYF